MDFAAVFNELPYLLKGTYPVGPLEGTLLTLMMSLMSGCLAFIMGVVCGSFLTLSKGWIAKILHLLLALLRSIPVVMLLFWTYFLLPYAFNVHLPAITTVIITLALIYGAYVALIVQAGLKSISKGQSAAGLSLGLTPLQVLYFITLPQALRIMLPSFINQGIALIKDTSLAYFLGVTELMMLTYRSVGSLSYYMTEIFIFSALIYLIMCGSLEILGYSLHKRREKAH